MTARLQLLLGLLVAQSACGRDVDLGDGDSSMSIADLCRRSAQTRCSANQTCCPDDRWVFDTVDACIADEEAECLIYGGAAFDDGRVSIDPDTAEALLTDLEHGAAACAELPTAPDVVDRLFVGTQPDGADCTFQGVDISPALSCAEGLYCVVQVGDFTSPGTCRPIAAPGEPCDPGGFELVSSCTSGNYCGDDGGGQTRCRPVVPNGSDCASSNQCASGYCNDCPDGTCEGPSRCEPEPAGPGPFCLYVGAEQWCTQFDGGGFSPEGAVDCHAQWTCPGSVYRVECTLDGGDYSCECLHDTIVVGQFRSAGYCDADDVDDETRRAAAETGCGWQIRY